MLEKKLDMGNLVENLQKPLQSYPSHENPQDEIFYRTTQFTTSAIRIASKSLASRVVRTRRLSAMVILADQSTATRNIPDGC